MNKKFIVFFIISAIVCAPAVMAGDKWGHHKKHRTKAKFVDYARVIDVDPIYETVHVSLPEKQCWQEKIHKPMKYQTHHNEAGKIVLGGIIGGVVGHHVGHGKSKDIATVAGSVIGATIGHNLANHSPTRIDKVSYREHCRTQERYHKERRLNGYWVSYRYKGEVFSTRMKQRPGKRIRVMVKLRPLQN